ncbi:uncharacterized protein [Bemisia tabaci]|uniref:uncharacterized protein n=1 Tax=Bemisia tabaci TaxID=7038 RepID=UPI003B287D8D
MMNIKYAVAAILLVTTQLGPAQGFGWAVVGIGTAVLGTIIDVVEKTETWLVEVHNEGKHDAHMWCASADDKIGPKEGLWVKPGEKVAWGFRRNRSTQFWCTMDWHGQRVGWDVFVTNWKDAPNPTKWSIRNDGVYDQWRNRKWRNLNS